MRQSGAPKHAALLVLLAYRIRKKSAEYNLKMIRAASSVCIAFWCRVHLCANILEQ
jgi:hypothetical protein